MANFVKFGHRPFHSVNKYILRYIIFSRLKKKTVKTARECLEIPGQESILPWYSTPREILAVLSNTLPSNFPKVTSHQAVRDLIHSFPIARSSTQRLSSKVIGFIFFHQPLFIVLETFIAFAKYFVNHFVRLAGYQENSSQVLCFILRCSHVVVCR